MISCPAGQSINIAYASYGRTSTAYCKSGVNLRKKFKCHAKSSVSKVQQRCNRQRNCILQSNNGVFGDPCVGTYKYLFVRYSCIPGKMLFFSTRGVPGVLGVPHLPT